MAIFEARKPTKLRPRSDFDAEEFRKLVFSHGLRVRWEQAAECPCSLKGDQVVGAGSALTAAADSIAQAVYTGEPRTNCVLCGGKGYFYHSSQNIRAVTTSARSKPEPFQIWGEYANGMISFSMLPEHLPAYQDRLTLLDSVLIYREIRRRSGAVVERLRYPVVSRSLDLEPGPLDFAGVLYAIPTDVEGEVEAGQAELVEGTDFEVTPAGEIDWTLGDGLLTAPVEGALYSISYYARPRFVVVDHPHSVRDTWVKEKTPAPTYEPLPVNAFARLEHLGDSND